MEEGGTRAGWWVEQGTEAQGPLVFVLAALP